MSYHYKSGAQKRREKAMRAEGVKGQNTLKQHGFESDVSDSVFKDLMRLMRFMIIRNVIDGYISQLLRSSSHLLHVAGYSS